MLDGELGAGAEPSRQLQNHCQGEHQGEPDASRARRGTCAGRRGAGSEPADPPSLSPVGSAAVAPGNSRAPKGPAKSLDFSIRMPWAHRPALPLVPPMGGPFFALGLLGWGQAPWCPSGPSSGDPELGPPL